MPTTTTYRPLQERIRAKQLVLEAVPRHMTALRSLIARELEDLHEQAFILEDFFNFLEAFNTPQPPNNPLATGPTDYIRSLSTRRGGPCK